MSRCQLSIVCTTENWQKFSTLDCTSFYALRKVVRIAGNERKGKGWDGELKGGLKRGLKGWADYSYCFSHAALQPNSTQTVIQLSANVTSQSANSR